ncbi:Hypothetical predicted protein [Mytilus galloprovincialis]|uniref:Ion transport domain-containing protein n=1 Tax=Mytilus galloprovincialis TaxID=29158 RepID=A0A8B6G1F6_MYTGA|nr:Hypothetical predicted protein [Mytilus galloprovincialis]
MIGIHHILVGCVILDDEINSWKTTTHSKEKLKRLKSAFTERAIRITSCIYDADKKIENTEFEAIEDNKKDKDEGEQQPHAARLLLNHGYHKDAINTKNNTYVESDTVKKILDEMWYDFYPYCSCCSPPVCVAFVNDQHGLPSFTLVIIAIIRKKWKSYQRDWYNRFDWMVIIGYTFGMILRNGEGSSFRITSKCLLLIAFMLLCVRVLKFCCMTSFLGPKLVIIQKMIKNTVAFMIIMAVIMIWYSVSYYALLYPNSEFTWKQIEHILSNGYWVLFGELNLDGDTLTEPDCTFNRTLYESGVLQHCPNQLGLYLTPYLKAFYGLIAVVLLLNLLIAIYSDTYAEIQKNSKFYWSEMQMCFLEEYSIKTVFPAHLQLLALPGIIVAIIAAVRLYLRTPKPNDGKKIEFNEQPMCVRAIPCFLYDTNYDMRLEYTKNAEEESAQEAIGKIDIDDFDEITVIIIM